MYDVIIVGAGPAGISAGLTACYFKLKALVLEATTVGGALTHAYPWKEPDSCLGMKGKSAGEIARLMINHVKAEGCHFRECEEVLEIKAGKTIRVKTDKASYQSRTVVLAIGTVGTPRKLGIPGEDSPKVAYFVKDPRAFKGKRVLVVGGGDSAIQCALGLEENKAKVWIAHRRDEFRCMDDAKCKVKESGIKVLWNTELKQVKGSKVSLQNNKTQALQEMGFDQIFIFAGSVMNTGFLGKIGVKLDGNKIVVDKDMKTNVKGVFAAGDITGGIKRIPQAIAQGETAVYSAYKFIKNPYWK
jgi:thioredoxin reductase (NADPH)